MRDRSFFIDSIQACEGNGGLVAETHEQQLHLAGVKDKRQQADRIKCKGADDAKTIAEFRSEILANGRVSYFSFPLLVDVHSRQANALVQTPEEENGSITVPNAANDKGDNDGAVRQEDRMFPEIVEAAELFGERPVDVVRQPTREGNMEIGPELLDIGFEERPIEILRKHKAHQPGGANGQVGVAREIKVQDKREGV